MDQDFLQGPAPDSLAWQRGKTMRRNGEHVTVQGGVGRETEEYAQTEQNHKPYANKGKDTGAVQTSTHALRAEIIVVTSCTT